MMTYKKAYAVPDIVARITGVERHDNLNLHEIFSVPVSDNQFMKDIQSAVNADDTLSDYYDRFVDKFGGIANYEVFKLNGYQFISGNSSVEQVSTFDFVDGRPLSGVTFACNLNDSPFMQVTMIPSRVDDKEINVSISIDFKMLIDECVKDFDSQFDEGWDPTILIEDSMGNADIASAIKNGSMVTYNYLVGLNCVLLID